MRNAFLLVDLVVEVDPRWSCAIGSHLWSILRHYHRDSNLLRRKIDLLGDIGLNSGLSGGGLAEQIDVIRLRNACRQGRSDVSVRQLVDDMAMCDLGLLCSLVGTVTEGRK